MAKDLNNPNIANEGKAFRFKKGGSGNPKGRPATKPFKEALRKKVEQALQDGDVEVIELLAEALVKKGLGGDVQALNSIRDVLDGRPVPVFEDNQEIEITEVRWSIVEKIDDDPRQKMNMKTIEGKAERVTP